MAVMGFSSRRNGWGSRASAPKPSAGAPKPVSFPNAVIPFDPVYQHPETMVGAIGNPVSNEPFDGRHHPALPWAEDIERGFIANHQPPGPYRLRFLYNPNHIDLSFQLSGSLTAIDQTAGIPTAGAIGGHTVGFKLLFDRHYEVAYGSDQIGVWQDIEVLKGLVGATANQGFMIQQALKFCFSTKLYGTFYGFIHTMEIAMGLFSKSMVPMMAEVSIGATFVPVTQTPSGLSLYTVGDQKQDVGAHGAIPFYVAAP